MYVLTLYYVRKTIKGDTYRMHIGFLRSPYVYMYIHTCWQSKGSFVMSASISPVTLGMIHDT